MSQDGYWNRVVAQRVARRRALAAAGGTAVAAALLAACGGGDGSDEPADRSGLIDRQQDTTAQAKPGGAIKDFFLGDASHFDAAASNANGVINWVSSFAYPQMLKLESPKYPNQPDGSIEGEAAESFELSGDKLTLTFKLRQNMKWDRRAPTNNRALDAEDILFTWNKYVQLNPAASNLAASRSPAAPVESVTSPDSRTIVVKMKKPDSSILGLWATWDGFYVMPKESDKEFDPRSVVRGHGPWMLEAYEPSVRFLYVKNPDYYLKGRPYPDRLEKPIMTEYAARLAQFKAGNIYTNVASPNDQIQTKRDAPGTIMQQVGEWSASIWRGIAFGYEGDSPFKDTRVRQAVSLLVDREGYIDALDNRDVFVREGIDVPVAYNTIVPPGWSGYWLDPTDEKKFGASAKYMKSDVAEAKKLLAAAGFPSGFEYDMYYSTTVYDAAYVRSAELYAAMFGEGGVKARMRGLPYDTFWNTYYKAYDAAFKPASELGFNGMVHLANPAAPTLASHLFTFVHKDGARFHGITPDGKNAHLGDPKLNSEIDKISAEFDRDKQITMTQDLIRYFTQQAYYIPRPGHVKGFTVTWPALADYSTYQRPPSDNQWSGRNIHWWIDPTKAPLSRA